MNTDNTKTIPDDWLKNTVAMAIRQGHRPIPMLCSGKPMPFKNGERYFKTRKIWESAEKDIIAIAMDDFILVDYDGNKPAGAVPLAELYGTLCDRPQPSSRERQRRFNPLSIPDT